MTTETTAASAAAATDTTATATTTATTADASPQITLRQFAIETSARDKRVELLHGFLFEETLARRFKDTEENYAARFTDFANKPV
jgi:hypothetical protein